MRALLSTAIGGPETLTVGDLPDPVAGAGEVIVAVKACAVNFPDVLIIEDKYQFKPQRPFAPGGEVSGVVESYLQDCWKWAAAKSEILPGAALTVEQIPAITLCEDCGQQYPTVPHGRTCPHCQSPHTHLLQGNEMMIKEVEAVEPETSEASG